MNKQSIIISLSLAIVLLIGGTQRVSAQKANVTASEIRDKARTVIASDYEMYATISDSEAQYAFIGLFVNEGAPVYNDLLGQGTSQTMPVGDYARLLGSKEFRSKRVTIKNINVDGDPRKEGNNWKVNVSFDKEISFYNSCGIYFSSREFYQSDYKLVATIVYDNVDGKCRIERIDGKIYSDWQLPADYFVFKNTNERDNQLSYHDQPLRFNSNNQALLGGSPDLNGFKHERLTEQWLHPILNDCNIVVMEYRPAQHRPSIIDDRLIKLRVNFGIGMGEEFKLDGGDDLKDKKVSGGWNAGVDIGYQFVTMDIFKLSGFVGVGLSQSSIDLGYDNSEVYFSYGEKDNADIDGCGYLRYYKDVKINQKVKMTDLYIPLYLDGECAFSEMVSAYVDLGVRFNMNMSKSVDIDSKSVKGIYGEFTSKYGKYILDEKWNNDGFNKDPFDKLKVGDIDGVSSMSIDLLAGAGVRFNIPNSPVAVDLGVSYLMGLGDIIKQENNSDSQQEKLIEYTWNKDGGEEKASSFTNKLKSVKRQSLRLNVGLIFKF